MKSKLFSSICINVRQIPGSRKTIYALLFLLFIYLVCVGIAPLHKINEYNRLVENDSVFRQQYDSLYDHPDLIVPVREKAFLEALMKLSAQDSIQAVVNLTDSTISLSIKGVHIHETKISAFTIDRLLQRMPNHQYIKLFSQPLMIHDQSATIVKEPIVVRYAPKDTAEAALNAWQPDPFVQYPAFLSLQLEYGIQILLEQDRNPTFYDKWTRFKFKSHETLKERLISFVNFFTLRKQEYKPTITIKLPVGDLRAIYRALPQNAQVVVRFG